MRSQDDCRPCCLPHPHPQEVARLVRDNDELRNTIRQLTKPPDSPVPRKDVVFQPSDSPVPRKDITFLPADNPMPRKDFSASNRALSPASASPSTVNTGGHAKSSQLSRTTSTAEGSRTGTLVVDSVHALSKPGAASEENSVRQTLSRSASMHAISGTMLGKGGSSNSLHRQLSSSSQPSLPSAANPSLDVMRMETVPVESQASALPLSGVGSSSMQRRMVPDLTDGLPGGQWGGPSTLLKSSSRRIGAPAVSSMDSTDGARGTRVVTFNDLDEGVPVLEEPSLHGGEGVLRQAADSYAFAGIQHSVVDGGTGNAGSCFGHTAMGALVPMHGYLEGGGQPPHLLQCDNDATGATNLPRVPPMLDSEAPLASLDRGAQTGVRLAHITSLQFDMLAASRSEEHAQEMLSGSSGLVGQLSTGLLSPMQQELIGSMPQRQASFAGSGHLSPEASTRSLSGQGSFITNPSSGNIPPERVAMIAAALAKRKQQTTTKGTGSKGAVAHNTLPRTTSHTSTMLPRNSSSATAVWHNRTVR